MFVGIVTSMAPPAEGSREKSRYVLLLLSAQWRNGVFLDGFSFGMQL